MTDTSGDIARLEINVLRAEQNLERQLDWVARFDTRIATVLGMLIAMLGVLATEAPPLPTWDQYCYFGTALSLVAIGVSSFAVYRALYPQTDSPNDSLLYFGTIAALKTADFAARFCSRADAEHLEDLCHQAHANAKIMQKKSVSLKVALKGLLTAVVFWTVTIAWFRIVRA